MFNFFGETKQCLYFQYYRCYSMCNGCYKKTCRSEILNHPYHANGKAHQFE